MKLDIKSCCLLIIDLQERLLPHIFNKEKIKHNSNKLVELFIELNVPIIYTEQYPKGLGHTLKLMMPFLSEAKFVEKNVFACTEEPIFLRCLIKTRPQIFLMGMEAHICILQTALDLIKSGKDVFIIEDAVVSRNILNKQNALNRLRDAGCIITNTESIIFEWLKTSENETFKKIAPLIKNID